MEKRGIFDKGYLPKHWSKPYTLWYYLKRKIRQKCLLPQHLFINVSEVLVSM